MGTRLSDESLTIQGYLYIPLLAAAELLDCSSDPDLLADLYVMRPVSLIDSVGPRTGIVVVHGKRWVPYDDLDQLRFWLQMWRDRPRRPRRRRKREDH